MQLSDALPADLSVGSTSIGVVVGPSPAGPWHDPIGKPLLANGSDYTPATQIRDPGVLQDGADYYIVFGTFESVKLTSLFLGHFSPIFARSFPVVSPFPSSCPQDSGNRHQDPEKRPVTVENGE